MRAVGATEERPRALHPVADYATAARLTAWRNSLYRTLKAIKCRALAARQDVEALVILVSANSAAPHSFSKMGNGTAESCHDTMSKTSYRTWLRKQ